MVHIKLTWSDFINFLADLGAFHEMISCQYGGGCRIKAYQVGILPVIGGHVAFKLDEMVPDGLISALLNVLLRLGGTYI